MQPLNFQPDWVSPPGETIVELMDEKGLSFEDLSKKLGLATNRSQKLLEGILEIDDMLACRLSNVLGASSSFWISRNNLYQEQRKKIDEARENWLASLPLKSMVDNGWIPKRLKNIEKFKACLKFFGIRNITDWEDEYNSRFPKVAFKKSSSYLSQPIAVFTWLKAAENQCENQEKGPWDPIKLEEEIPFIRNLTRHEDPSYFIPKLKSILASAGVSLSIVKSPSGCRASGATYFLGPNDARMVLSFRHLTDDHFWFTVFHEIGHLILHGKKKLFLEEESDIAEEEEKEANEFALNVLIPTNVREEMFSFRVKDWKQIIRFSAKIGICPGIVVGQLQHANLIPFSHLNKLKRRYKWN